MVERTGPGRVKAGASGALSTAVTPFVPTLLECHTYLHEAGRGVLERRHSPFRAAHRAGQMAHQAVAGRCLATADRWNKGWLAHGIKSPSESIHAMECSGKRSPQNEDPQQADHHWRWQ
jgi:hypothetical protein